MIALELCLEQVLRHHEPEVALIVLESAVNTGAVSSSAAMQLITRLPASRQHGLRHFSERAESGSETRVRLFFQRHRVRVRPQMQIGGIGRVDMLVGNSMIVECDSAAYHSGSDSYAKDHWRNLTASRLGFCWVRLTYYQIFLEWEATQEALLDLVRTERHHRDPSPRAVVWEPETR